VRAPDGKVFNPHTGRFIDAIYIYINGDLAKKLGKVSKSDK
jgi:hypothetical protein